MLSLSRECTTNHDTDVWFHRYENGRDIEGRFDYNSWQESDKGLKLAASLDKDIVLAEGTFISSDLVATLRPQTLTIFS